MRGSWTDKRLDDLNDKVDQRFERIDADLRPLRVETRTEFTALRTEMESGFGRVDQRFERLDERLDDRFDALHRLMVQFGGAMIVALVGLIATRL
ncbi:MAG TPA: hypothetical protein VHM66_05230 [Solirubrobacterales bacterium]|nr:hypothetical protein [Solirubrobacterales bacterium]